MTSAGWVTVVLALVTVLVLAAFLISVALILRGVDNRLTQIAGHVGAINEKSGPVGPVIREINRDLTGLNAGLQRVLTKPRPAKR
jgi:hypothetical protein